MDGLGSAGRRVVRVHAHLSEIMAEARLEECPFGVWQGFPCALDGVDPRPHTGCKFIRLARGSLGLGHFFLRFFSLSLNSWIGHAHYLIGHPIRLLLVNFSWSTNCQLWLTLGMCLRIHRYPAEVVRKAR